MNRLLDTAATLYSELLEQLQSAQASSLARSLQGGGVVAKVIGGRRYWYLQRTVGTDRIQKYLGPDTPELARTIATLRSDRNEQIEDEKARTRLSAMLVEGGAFAPPAGIRSVLGALSEAGFFRLGAVLVGTQAMALYGNLLGFRLPAAALTTQDIDIAGAADIDVAVAVAEDQALDATAALTQSGLPFLPVPGLDPRESTTSFKVRGRELRVDFLTPARGRKGGVIALRRFGVAAQPLPFLDYLLEEPISAAVVGGAGVLVRVPTPARFALHKLWTSEQRPASQQTRAQKDLRQAGELLEILASERPRDIDVAWDALTKRPERVRPTVRALKRLGGPWSPRAVR